MKRLLILCDEKNLSAAFLDAMNDMTGSLADTLVFTDWNDSAKTDELKKELQGSSFVVAACSMPLSEEQILARAFFEESGCPVLFASGISLPVLLRLFEMKDEVDTVEELKKGLEGGRPYALSFQILCN